MNDQGKNDSGNVLLEQHERLLARTVEGLQADDERSLSLIHRLVDDARDRAVRLKEVSREDAEKLAAFLKHDLTQAANYLSTTGSELKDWLGFDATLLETAFLEPLLEAADPTTVELLALKEQAELAPCHSGQITTPGTLECDKCGEKLHFYRSSKIPPCPRCHATSFHRSFGI